MKRLFMLLEMVLLTFAASCVPKYPSIEALLITTDIFPSGWSADVEGPQPSPSAPFGGIQSIERTMLFFQSTSASAFQEIERFRNREDANQEFLDQKTFLFTEDRDDGPYTIPDELPYQSSIAEQSYFSCVRPSYYPYPYLGCFYLGQYGPYVVKFHIGWNLDAMSADELEKILRTIDEKMVLYTN